jgi:hypothetical protein
MPRGRTAMIEWRGRSQPMTAWARELGISPSAMRRRLSLGTVDQALSEPRQRRGRTGPRGTYAIQSGIPLPAAGVGKRSRFPFRSMAVGDSFFVPAVDAPPKTVRQAVRTQHQLHGGARYTSRECTELGVHGIRVWRTS